MKSLTLIAGAMLAGLSVNASAQPVEAGASVAPVATPSAIGLPGTRPAVDSSIEFPNPNTSAYPRAGVFVNPRNLVMVTPGMTKRQVYALLPPPHFGEGLFGVRQWNYVLNFYTGTGGEYVTCQYQIRYDSHVRVSGTWFRDQVCADWLNYLLDTPAGTAPATAASQ